ncbi:MAG: hypothetical protein KKH68_01955, partial [Proteobacteria bacterium]|nr:hypothetical protein [Pseudomonadota bacterium]
MTRLLFEKDMDEKSNYFLREFLKATKKTDDNISIRLSILFTLKHVAPIKFKALKLDQYLENVISEIKETVQKPTSYLKSVTSRIKGIVNKSRPLYDLQAKLDYWYYTKLLGYGDEYKVNDEMIKKIIT